MSYKQINDAVESAYDDGGTLIPVINRPTDAPTGFSATAGNGRITLSWNAVAGAGSFNVYRDGQRVNVAPIVAFSYTDLSVIKGTAYTYTVTAVNAGGESVQSVAVMVTVLSAPNPPVNLTATVGLMRITLDWDAPAASPTASVPTSYNLYRGGSLFVSGLTATVYSDLDVVTNVTYPYTVTAVSTIGESAFTTSVSAVPTPPPSDGGGGTTPPVVDVAGVQMTYTGDNLTEVREIDALGGAITRSDLAYNGDGTINTITDTEVDGRKFVTTLRYVNGDLDPANPLTRAEVTT